MIDGLGLTMTGEELRRLLNDRVEEHRASAECWAARRDESAVDENGEDVQVPEHICANEVERHEWRAAVLEFIRDHVEALEVYRLRESDMTFAELLPAKPGWLEQSEYEERTAIGFGLEQISRRISRCPGILETATPDARSV